MSETSLLRKMLEIAKKAALMLAGRKRSSLAPREAELVQDLETEGILDSKSPPGYVGQIKGRKK